MILDDDLPSKYHLAEYLFQQRPQHQHLHQHKHQNQHRYLRQKFHQDLNGHQLQEEGCQQPEHLQLHFHRPELIPWTTKLSKDQTLQEFLLLQLPMQILPRVDDMHANLH